MGVYENDVSDAFALKGGTGIRKAYVEGYRFSVDLDFALTRRVDVRGFCWTPSERHRVVFCELQ